MNLDRVVHNIYGQRIVDPNGAPITIRRVAVDALMVTTPNITPEEKKLRYAIAKGLVNGGKNLVVDWQMIKTLASETVFTEVFGGFIEAVDEEIENAKPRPRSLEVCEPCDTIAP